MKDTLQFLKKLEVNNSKEWMDANRDNYQQIRANFLELTGSVLQQLVELEPGLAGLTPKDCTFRQNRDIRFSANKNPYKVNMAAYFAVGGKKSEGPGYYLHLQPGESFVGGGIYWPASEVLKRIRQEIDYSGGELKSIISDKSFYEHFGEIEGERLKTSPKGYPKEHPYIEFLRLKSFIASRPLSDEEVTAADFKAKVMESFTRMKPLNDFLTKAVEEAEGEQGLL